MIELKAGKFKPEFVGKLSFYISAVDDLLKTVQDNATIGILICKSKNNTVVEYALKDIHKPIGVSEYLISQNLPDELKSSLPSIEAIENELREENVILLIFINKKNLKLKKLFLKKLNTNLVSQEA